MGDKVSDAKVWAGEWVDARVWVVDVRVWEVDARVWVVADARVQGGAKAQGVKVAVVPATGRIVKAGL